MSNGSWPDETAIAIDAILTKHHNDFGVRWENLISQYLWRSCTASAITIGIRKRGTEISDEKLRMKLEVMWHQCQLLVKYTRSLATMIS